MNNNDWQAGFRKVWDRAVVAWKAGKRSPDAMFSREDAEFLTSIGHTKQEVFDYVDDGQRYDDVDYATAEAVAAIRRDYFLDVMGGKFTGKIVPMSKLPSKGAQVDGISWLPRLIVKARIKLRGEMDPDLMYGCAGDRPFLRGMNMTLPQFLKLTWEAGDDDRKIVDTVKQCAGRK